MAAVSNTLNAVSTETPARTIPPPPVLTSARVRTPPPTIDQNRLLEALPEEVYGRLAPDLERVRMPLGWVLQESGERLRFIYFPIDSLVSLSCGLENGSSGEIAVVGNEGLVGIAPFMGGQTMQNRAVVQIAGTAFRIRTDVLVQEFENGGPLHTILLRYIQALITQIAQSVACNRHHLIEQQLCRKLLMSLDRMPSNELAMTHELIAVNLGVRREGVTEAAGKLRADGLIDCGRGKFTVLDRPRLEKRVCECYAAVKKEYDRLQPNNTGVRTLN